MNQPLNPVRRQFGSYCPGGEAVVFILFILLLSVFLFSGCSGGKKSEKNASQITNLTLSKKDVISESSSLLPATEQAQEAKVKAGTLMVTFSTSNDLLKDYPHFKLGLFDIIVYVRSGDTLYKQSLYDLAPVSEGEYTNASPLELTRLKKDSYLYHGLFNVPVGTLESIKVQFSGAKSSITIGSEVPALIDAFFFSYTGGDARLPARLYPAEVTTGVPAGFILTEDNMGMLCINIDMNLSVGLEPLKHSDPEQKYALFVPAISAKSMDSDVNMTIRQSNLITMKNGDMGIGDPEGVLFSSAYSIDESAVLSVDADSVTDLNDVSGIYAIDLMGAFSSNADGYNYVINSASMLGMADDSTVVQYEGKVVVSGEGMKLDGYALSLNIDELSVNGSEYFNGQIVGNPTDLGLAEGDMAVIWSDGVTSKVIMKPDASAEAESKEVFELRSTVSIAPVDILAIKTASKDEAYVTLTLPEVLACADYITDISTGVGKICDSALTAIDIPLANTGNFTLIETRKGFFHSTEEAAVDEEQASSDGQTEAYPLPGLAIESDIVHHFLTADAFFNVLETKVALEGYRLVVMIAEGSMVGETFTMGGIAKVIILQPQPLLDDEADGWVAGLESSISEQLVSTNKEKIGLYTGLALGGAVVAILGGYLVYKIFKYRQTKAIEGLGVIAFESDPLAFDKILVESGESTLGSKLYDSWTIKVGSNADKLNVLDLSVRSDGSVYAKVLDETGRAVDIDGKLLPPDIEDKTIKVMSFDGRPVDGVTIEGDKVGQKTPNEAFKQKVVAQFKPVKYKPVIVWDAKTKAYKFDDKPITKVQFDVNGKTKTLDFSAKKGTISGGANGIKVSSLTQLVLPTTLFRFDSQGGLQPSSKYINVKIFSDDENITKKIEGKLQAEKIRVNGEVEKAKEARVAQSSAQKKFTPDVIFSDISKLYRPPTDYNAERAKANSRSAQSGLDAKGGSWITRIFRKIKR